MPIFISINRQKSALISAFHEVKNIKEKIQKDLEKSLKDRKDLQSLVLRMLLAAILNREKEKRYKIAKTEPEIVEEELVDKSQLTKEEVMEVISSEIKKRKEAILEFSAYAKGYGGPAEAPITRSEGGEKGEKEDSPRHLLEKVQGLVKKEKAEIEILQKYLPEQLSEEEIKKLAREIIEKVGATELKDMGRVMAELMPQIKGRAEGSLVSKIVKELLTPKIETKRES